MTMVGAIFVLQRFFFTSKAFSRKDAVKSVVDVEMVLSHGSSSNEWLAESALYLVFSVIVVGTSLDERKKHGYYLSGVRSGIVEKMWSVFKGCKFTNGKRNLCLSFVYLHSGERVEEKYVEMVEFVGGVCDEESKRGAVEASENVWKRLNGLSLSLLLLFISFSYPFLSIPPFFLSFILLFCSFSQLLANNTHITPPPHSSHLYTSLSFHPLDLPSSTSLPPLILTELFPISYHYFFCLFSFSFFIFHSFQVFYLDSPFQYDSYISLSSK
jgi:hypothetical protein